MIPDRKADRAHIQEEETPRPCLPQRLSWQNPLSKGGVPLAMRWTVRKTSLGHSTPRTATLNHYLFLPVV